MLRSEQRSNPVLSTVEAGSYKHLLESVKYGNKSRS